MVSPSESYLRKLYAEFDMTPYQIAVKLNSTPTEIRRLLLQYGLITGAESPELESYSAVLSTISSGIATLGTKSDEQIALLEILAEQADEQTGLLITIAELLDTTP